MKILGNNKHFDLIFSLILLGLLLIVAFPSLYNPPISDYWPTMFYPFHSFEALPGPTWIHVLNIDPCEQMRYQPLSRIFYYILHSIFGSNYFMYNFFNLIFYYISMLLLYKFSLRFSENRPLCSFTVVLTTFLFSHFDLVLWSCHMYILIGLITFLLGFICYIDFLKTRNNKFLLFAALLFLAGMWCYEAFVLWPFAILILSSIKNLKKEIKNRQPGSFVSNFILLGTVYSTYIATFIYTRSIGTYETPIYKYSALLKISNFLLGGLTVLFNTFYNTIILNTFPPLAFPLQIKENLYLKGPLIKYFQTHNNSEAIFYVGAAFGLALLTCIFILFKKKYREELKVIFLFLFLMLTTPFITFSLRMVDNAYLYCITEFRYQFIPNIFLILLITYIISKVLKLSDKALKTLYKFSIPIIILNIICILIVAGIYRRQLAPLRIMFASISAGIKSGLINEDHKVYIDNNLPDYMPALCWNIEMGERYVKEGNYKWLFFKK